MTNKIIPSQDITVDTLKEVFQNAYYTILPFSADPDGDYAFTVEFWDKNIAVSVDPESKTIKIFTAFYPEESSKEALIPHANYLNNGYHLVRFFVE